MNESYSGIFPALVTPYTKKNEINETSLRKLVSWNLSKGVKGFYVCGTTAEALMLSLEERKNILEIVVDENKNKVKIICHVGCISTDDSIELTHHACELGVDSISSIPPFYYPFTLEEIKSHYILIAEASNKPIIIYNFPSNSGFKITYQFLNFTKNYKNKFIGLKHTSKDLYELEKIVNHFNDFVVLSGYDEMFLGAIAMGAHGAIGSTYNFMSEIFIQLMSSFNQGKYDEARELQRKANLFVNLMENTTGIPQVKAALEILGIECNGCRNPIMKLNNSTINKIEKTMKIIELI